MRGVALARGACGELVQGMVDGKYFLITCPINISAEATVTLIPGGRLQGPPGKSKALAAVRLAMALLGEKQWGARLAINNPLPPGKGLASSTADVAAAAAATARALGAELSLEEIKRIALAIEPSDGTFLPGIVLFDHLRGEFWESLGEPPPLAILIVDLGGTVDTVLFNQRRDLMTLNQAREGAVRQAVALVREGLARGRAELIARGATLSALTNQEILYKPELETLLELATSLGALGVNAAHSGTVAGILYRPGEVDIHELERKIRAVFPYVHFIRATMTGGGVEARDEPWFMGKQVTAVGS
ncbi:GHMP kinase [Moorella stamsii (nom. illeg.)]|uniref:L-threonine kinase n=1 Tax=Neomoorella stamsii TaxID=1266720 RepID=A0A9X7J1E3_9FIRM|nr:GHMP kinase [Moorella stamsii]PRR71468.1 L-threonine kinase [Moorella stamsii]